MPGGSPAQPTAMDGDEVSGSVAESSVIEDGMGGDVAGRYLQLRCRRHRLTGRRAARRFPRVKPGELERNLSRLVEAARTARERLASMAQDLATLRLEMERL